MKTNTAILILLVRLWPLGAVEFSRVILESPGGRGRIVGQKSARLKMQYLGRGSTGWKRRSLYPLQAIRFNYSPVHCQDERLCTVDDTGVWRQETRARFQRHMWHREF